jgi:lipid A ethanolaminephosphotransferase
MKKVTLSSGVLILGVVFFLTLSNNSLFFNLLLQRLDIFSIVGAAYIVTFYLLMVAIISVLLLIFAQYFLLKPILILLLILSAISSYFIKDLGVIFEVDMIRNIIETLKDNNQQEALELLSLPLISHVIWLGILPSILLLFVKIRPKSVLSELGSRIIYSISITALVLIMTLLNFKYVSYFSRENRDLRVWITPIFPLRSLYKYTAEHFENRHVAFKLLGMDAVQNKPKITRTVGIMVVGETARADHFSLNGYSRITNPHLSQENILNLENVHSCGTSTAFSVPCMFSLLSKVDYSPNLANKQSNVLDVLTQAGVKTIWIDNNSSCKDVCTRIENENIHNYPKVTSSFANKGEYYDENLLKKIPSYINNNQADTLIVLHTLGSHGPAYHRRYPKEFAQFKPYCDKNAPQECSNEEVTNAYDNTILYTDYLLSQIITYLKQHQDQYESFVFYASDHGESLGENGIYLHGLPYVFAPEAQTHIPMLAWLSDNFQKNHAINLSVLQAQKKHAYSHDNLSHSLLGLFNVRSQVYLKNKDIFKQVLSTAELNQ